jgi:branched-chain amino acid transport system substrate-binding protein
MVSTAKLKIYPVVFLILLIAFSGCGPRIILKPDPVGTGGESGQDSFSEAEKLYQLGDHGTALAQYLLFIEKYPGSSLVPAALMNTGRIYEIRGDYTSAYRYYARIATDHPDTVFAPDAAVEMLVMLFKQGKYPELIRQSSQLPKASFTRTHTLRISILAGDAFISMDAPVEAAYAFITAQRFVRTPSDEKTVRERLVSALSRLNADDIRMLSMRMQDPEDIKVLNTLHRMALFKSDTIGCMLPLSGAYAVFGQRALKGIELALNRFSIQEGINYKIIVKDTRSDHGTAVKCVRELVEEEAACIIGPIATAGVAAAVAQENRIPMIALTQKDGIPETGDFIFRNFITSRMQVETLVSYAVKRMDACRFALLYPKEKYGVTFMNLFWDEVINQGGEVVGVESYELDQMDFVGPIKKLAGLYYEIPDDLKTAPDPLADEMILFPGEEEPPEVTKEPTGEMVSENGGEGEGEAEEPRPIVDFDVLFLPDSPKKAGLIIPQLAYYDVDDVILFGTNLWHSDELIAMAGSYAQGAVLTDGFFDSSAAFPVKAFVAAFSDTYEEKPGFIEAVAYDSAMMVFTLLAKNDITLREEIREALTVMPYFDGVTGLTAFNETGEADKRLYLLKIIRNRFAELEY